MKVKFSTTFHKRGCIFEDDPIPLEGEGEVTGSVRVDGESCFVVLFEGKFWEIPVNDCEPVK